MLSDIGFSQKTCLPCSAAIFVNLEFQKGRDAERLKPSTPSYRGNHVLRSSEQTTSRMAVLLGYARRGPLNRCLQPAASSAFGTFSWMFFACT